MKAEEKQKLMQECLQYFRERPVYEKVFQKMRGKYESLGHIGGKVVLTGLSLQDKSQLGGFLRSARQLCRLGKMVSSDRKQWNRGKCIWRCADRAYSVE